MPSDMISTPPRPSLQRFPYPGYIESRFFTRGPSPFADRVDAVLDHALPAYGDAHRLSAMHRIDASHPAFPKARTAEQWTSELASAQTYADDAVEGWSHAVKHLGPLAATPAGAEIVRIDRTLASDLSRAIALGPVDAVKAVMVTEPAAGSMYEAAYALQHLESRTQPLLLTGLGKVTALAGLAALGGAAYAIHRSRS